MIEQNLAKAARNRMRMYFQKAEYKKKSMCILISDPEIELQFEALRQCGEDAIESAHDDIGFRENKKPTVK